MGGWHQHPLKQSIPQRKLFHFPKYQGATKEFSWGKEQQKAFKTLPTLARPMVGETLYLYVAASHAMISVVLQDSFKCRNSIHNYCKDNFCSSYCNSKAPAILWCSLSQVVVWIVFRLKKVFIISIDMTGWLNGFVELNCMSVKYQTKIAIKG